MLKVSNEIRDDKSFILSHDQLRRDLLIGRNAVTWRSSSTKVQR